MKKTLTLSALLLLLAAGCQQESINNQNPPIVQNMVTFSNYHQAGFEGVDTKFDYSIKYLADKFRTEKATQGFNITEIENGNVHRVLFGYNGAMGAQSSSEYWDALNHCESCVLTANDIEIEAADDLKTYANDDEEWVIYKAGNDFVLINMKKPNSAVKEILKTFTVQTSEIRK